MPQPVDERLRWRLRDDVRANPPEMLLPYYDRWRALSWLDDPEPVSPEPAAVGVREVWLDLAAERREHLLRGG